MIVTYHDLQAFLSALERDGDLARVTAPVDPHLEVAGIVQRVVREQGPALLFENPTRGRMPLAMNVFGTERRMAKALGVDDLDEIGARIGDLLKPEMPHGRRWAARRAGQGGAAAQGAAAARQGRAVPGGRREGRRRRPVRPARHQVLARRRRRVPQPRPDPHQAPGDRRAQPRHVPPAAAGRAHRQPALADPQGLHVARGDRRAARRAAAGGDRVRLPARGDVRGVRAAARRHRRVPVRRVPAARARRDGRLPDRAAAGAGRRADRARGLGASRASGCPRGRSATTPASTRRSSRSRSCASRR